MTSVNVIIYDSGLDTVFCFYGDSLVTADDLFYSFPADLQKLELIVKYCSLIDREPVYISSSVCSRLGHVVNFFDDQEEGFYVIDPGHPF